MIIEHGVPISFKLGDEGILSPDQVDKILELAAWSEKSNPACMLARLLSTLLPILPVFLQICDTISFSSELFIRMVWSDLLNLWNEALCITLCTKLKAAFSLKLSIPRNSIYNFTQVEIDPRMKELLAHGPSHIPVFIDSPDNIFLALDDLDQFCIGLAANAAKVFCSPGKIKSFESSSRSGHPNGNSLDTVDVIKGYKLISPASLGKFFDVLLHKYLAAIQEIGSIPKSHPGLSDPGIFNSYGEVTQNSSPPGTIFILADKGRGITLLPMDVLLKAEKKLLTSLQASPSPLCNEESILSHVRSKIDATRGSLDSKQASFMKQFPPMPLEGQEVSYLKLSAKVHKLSEEQIKSKDYSKLSFRPICDSTKFPIRPIAVALFKLLLSLKNKLFSKFPPLESFLPVSGQHYAKSLGSLPQFLSSPDPCYIFISADLSDAYSNCHLPELREAYLFLASLVGEFSWAQELVLKFADLVLTNNYVKSGNYFYLLGDMLPMGSSCSGEALDIIALAGEVMAFVSPPLNPLSLQLLPSYIKPSSGKILCNSYSRYRDDTMIFFSAGDGESIVSFIQDVSTRIFPPSIPISLEISVFFSSFLDVCFFPNFSNFSLNTFLRLNLDAPGKVPHFSSNSPNRYLLAPCVSNVIRAYRTISHDKIFKVTKELFISEYISIGYPDYIVNHLRTRIGALLKLHSESEPILMPDISGYALPQGTDSAQSTVGVLPPSVYFCKATSSHTFAFDIWACCKDLLPPQPLVQTGSIGEVRGRGVPLKLRLAIKTSVSSKSLYFKKLSKFNKDSQ